MTRLSLPRVSTLSFKRSTVIRVMSALLALLTIGTLAGIAEACIVPLTVPISGHVVDQNGNPVPGATVTLLSGGPLGQFVPSRIPQTTELDGAYGWLAAIGFYEVTAQKDGCLDVTSPPQLVLSSIADLRLVLQCGAPIVTPAVDVTGGSMQYGQSGTFTATVSQTVPAALGAIQFKVDGANLGSPVALANGSADSPNLSTASGFPYAVGSHGVEADFIPANLTNFGPNLGTSGFTVNKAASATQLALQGSSAAATISAVSPGSGTPTGAVSFTRDGTAIGTAQLNNGVATLTDLAAGAGNVAATYAGDSNFTGSSASTARQMPSIVGTVTSPLAKTSYGWYRSAVTVSFTCTTTSAPLTAPCPSPVTLPSSGAAQSVTKTILAQDGGTATAVVNGINIDMGRPQLWVEGVASGHHYTSAPTVSCVGEDTLSGIASCTVAVGRASHGVVHYTATATDKAGNIKTVRGVYFLSR